MANEKNFGALCFPILSLKRTFVGERSEIRDPPDDFYLDLAVVGYGGSKVDGPL